jgi:hypothetical protein
MTTKPPFCTHFRTKPAELSLHEWGVISFCEYGFCEEIRCPVCRYVLMGVGPMLCPCDDTVLMPDQRRKPSAPVKPSIARRRLGKGHKPARRITSYCPICFTRDPEPVGGCGKCTDGEMDLRTFLSMYRSIEA